MKSKADRAVEIQKIIAILHQWGIHSLGQFAALEKEDVALRLGPEAMRMWERASGTATRLLKLVEPPESFVESFEFENEIETSEPLLFMLRRFLEHFAVRFGAHYLVAQELRLRIIFSDNNSYERVFKIPQPSNNIETLFRMLHTHLENFTSAAPIVAVTLEAEPTKPTRQQFSLFETALRDPAQLSETLARLVGLLGADCVGTPILENTFRPDAFRMQPFSWELPNESLTTSMPAVALRRFRPAPMAVVFLDEKRPAHLRSSEVQGDILQQDGPYRSSGNWWDEKKWSRSEWDFEIESAVLCRCHAEGNAWRIDGIYD